MTSEPFKSLRSRIHSFFYFFEDISAVRVMYSSCISIAIINMIVKLIVDIYEINWKKNNFFTFNDVIVQCPYVHYTYVQIKKRGKLRKQRATKWEENFNWLIFVVKNLYVGECGYIWIRFSFNVQCVKTNFELHDYVLSWLEFSSECMYFFPPILPVNISGDQYINNHEMLVRNSFAQCTWIIQFFLSFFISYDMDVYCISSSWRSIDLLE